MNIDDLTLGQIKESQGMCGATKNVPPQSNPYEIGAPYLIRCVTHYYTGRMVEVCQQELVLEDAAWIPDTGRYSEAIKSGKVSEVEPIVGQLIIGRGAVIDAVKWPNNIPLPREMK